MSRLTGTLILTVSSSGAAASALQCPNISFIQCPVKLFIETGSACWIQAGLAKQNSFIDSQYLGTELPCSGMLDSRRPRGRSKMSSDLDLRPRRVRLDCL